MTLIILIYSLMSLKSGYVYPQRVGRKKNLREILFAFIRTVTWAKNNYIYLFAFLRIPAYFGQAKLFSLCHVRLTFSSLPNK